MATTEAISPAAAVAASLHDGKVHLLLAASGSVAAIKLPLIIASLAERHPPSSSNKQLSIRLVLTEAAARFFTGQNPEQPSFASLASLPNVDGVYVDADEWWPWSRGCPILHIELRRWSHLLAICPLSANMLAKITRGLCDDLLSNTVRAWDAKGTIDGLVNGQRKRIIVAPAMNTAMWEHPITAPQIRVLEEEWGIEANDEGWFEVLRPQEKTLACGDTGVGAMMGWERIVEVIEARLGLNP